MIVENETILIIDYGSQYTQLIARKIREQNVYCLVHPYNKINSKIIKTGSISSSINTGSVSSLYSVDENNNFAKERLARYLASKLYRKILLNTYTSEN